MDVTTFPVPADKDRRLADRLSRGSSDRLDRVLTYLVLRREDPDLEEATATGDTPDAWYTCHLRVTTIRGVDERYNRWLPKRAAWVDRLPSPAGPLPAQALSPIDERRPTDRLLAIKLNWQLNALYHSLFAARAADRGPPLEFEPYSGFREAVDAVDSGAVDVGVVGAATVARTREQKLSIVSVAVAFQRSTVVLFTLAGRFETPFESMTPPRGRGVGVPADTETGLLARFLLGQAGLGEFVVNLKGEECAVLVAGEVDAMTGTFPYPNRLEYDGWPVKAVSMAEKHPVYGSALIVRRETLERRRPLLEVFLRAVIAGRAVAVDEEAAVQEVTASTGEFPDWVVRTFERTANRFDIGEVLWTHGRGWHSHRGWNGVHTALPILASIGRRR